MLACGSMPRGARTNTPCTSVLVRRFESVCGPFLYLINPFTSSEATHVTGCVGKYYESGFKNLGLTGWVFFCRVMEWETRSAICSALLPGASRTGAGLE